MYLTETAYAKINLALHVRARRDDGYHELETLFAFVDCGDELVIRSAEQDYLQIVGKFGTLLTADPDGDPFGNIVMKALGSIPRSDGWAMTLEKNLPVAAGLGGGSADAGAIFRAARRKGLLPDDWHHRAAKLGADVPACVESVTCIGRGTGTDLEPIESDLTGAAVLLVNPRIPLATGPVFTAWDGVDRGPMPEGKVSEIAQNGRNDLEAPAISLVPEIAEVLSIIAQSGADLARMSGSGATCFGLYPDVQTRDEAARKIALCHPKYWQASGALR